MKSIGGIIKKFTFYFLTTVHYNLETDCFYFIVLQKMAIKAYSTMVFENILPFFSD